jgi:hypothetical protein
LIEYKLESGEMISNQITVGGMPYDIGDNLPVYYDRNDPYNMILDPGKSYIVIVIFTLLIALSMMGACFMINKSMTEHLI